MWNQCEHEQLAVRKSHYVFFEEAQLKAIAVCRGCFVKLREKFLPDSLHFWMANEQYDRNSESSSRIPPPNMKSRCREGVKYKKRKLNGVIERQGERGLCKGAWYWTEPNPSSNKNNHSLLLTNVTNQLGEVLRPTKSSSHGHVFLV